MTNQSATRLVIVTRTPADASQSAIGGPKRLNTYLSLHDVQGTSLRSSPPAQGTREGGVARADPRPPRAASGDRALSRTRRHRAGRSPNADRILRRSDVPLVSGPS